MALKAGRVGVNPKYVDSDGKPIGSGGSSDAYTKAEADAKFATKTALAEKADASSVYTKTAADDKFAVQTDLTANSKKFVFAYSGGQYGYKAGATGDFHPFEEAGVTYFGWVPPADLITTGLTLGDHVSLLSGGYKTDGIITYVNIVLAITDNITANEALVTFPTGIPRSNANMLMRVFSTVASEMDNANPAPVLVGTDGVLKALNNYPVENYKKLYIWGAVYSTT